MITRSSLLRTTARLAIGALAWAATRAEVNAGEDPRIEDLLARMTLEEMAGQLSLLSGGLASTGPEATPGLEAAIADGAVGGVFNAYGAAYTERLQRLAVERTRLGIPLLLGFDVVHGHRTIFPIPLGQAAIWDLDAIEGAERIAAREAAASGVGWTFAPMVDVTRDPRWGRVAEGAGESAWLGARIAAARVRGLQGLDLAAADALAACPKHFAAYGATTDGRDYYSADISERSLRETYLPPFDAAVRAGAATMMAAFNAVDGLPGVANDHLLGEILRGEWNFDGVVVSDYGAVLELTQHGLAADPAEAARIALLAGTDMDMESASYRAALPGLVRSGVVPRAVLDCAVRRVLRLKAGLGLLDDPYRRIDAARERATLMAPAHRDAALALAEASLVLLKNDGPTLPFDRSIRRLALIGPLADAPWEMLGPWRGAGQAADTISLRAGLATLLGRSTEIAYAAGGSVEAASPAEIAEAVAAARGADAVVLAVGERAAMSGEAASRTRLDLGEGQAALAAAVLDLGLPTAVVLFNGRPLTLVDLDRLAPAILEAWFPGTMGGLAVARVLFGDAEPRGRLPITFPRSVGQVPIHHDQDPTGRPASSDPYSSRYLDEDVTPLYPFGWGLAYTRFAFAPPRLDRSVLRSGEAATVSVEVRNEGERPGTALVQLYLRQKVASVTRPVKLLRGFAPIALDPGASGTVELTIGEADLAFWRKDMSYGVEPGPIELMTGPNAAETQSVLLDFRPG